MNKQKIKNINEGIRAETVKVKTPSRRAMLLPKQSRGPALNT